MTRPDLIHSLLAASQHLQAAEAAAHAHDRPDLVEAIRAEGFRVGALIGKAARRAQGEVVA